MTNKYNKEHILRNYHKTMMMNKVLKVTNNLRKKMYIDHKH